MVSIPFGFDALELFPGLAQEEAALMNGLTAIAAANVSIAAELAEIAAVSLEASVANRGRDQARPEQGYLAADLRDPENRSANPDGFVFIDQAFMDSRARSKLYWRAQEHGTSAMVGRWIHGTWSDGGSGGRTGAFLQGSEGRLYQVHNPIPGYHYIEAAAAAFNTALYRERIAVVLREAGVPEPLVLTASASVYAIGHEVSD